MQIHELMQKNTNTVSKTSIAHVWTYILGVAAPSFHKCVESTCFSIWIAQKHHYVVIWQSKPYCYHLSCMDGVEKHIRLVQS